MKKLLFGLIMAIAVPCMADWIEPYGVDCADDLFTGTVISTSGLVNYRSFWQNPPTADSDTLKNIAGSVQISTSALVGGTSTFADATYFTLQKYARTIGVSFDIAFGSNAFSGTLTVTGKDARGITQTEVINATCTTVTYGNIPFQSITSAVLAITNWGSSTDRGTSSGGTANAYTDLSKIYPRFATGTKLGLLMIPCSSTAMQVSMDDTAEIPGWATLDLTYGTVSFTTAPDGAHEYEVTYKARGAK